MQCTLNYFQNVNGLSKRAGNSKELLTAGQENQEVVHAEKGGLGMEIALLEALRTPMQHAEIYRTH